jgi:uncharacterized OB-fold protein
VTETERASAARTAAAKPDAARPLPVPDEQSAPFWQAAADHVLALARCTRCGSFALPPGVACPHCHSTDPAYAFEPVNRGGRVQSWTVMRQSFLPGFDDDVPFVLVDVELDVQEGLRMIGRLLDGPDAPLRLDDRVAVAFEDLAPGVSVPAFALEARA